MAFFSPDAIFLLGITNLSMSDLRPIAHKCRMRIDVPERSPGWSNSAFPNALAFLIDTSYGEYQGPIGMFGDCRIDSLNKAPKNGSIEQPKIAIPQLTGASSDTQVQVRERLLALAPKIRVEYEKCALRFREFATALTEHGSFSAVVGAVFRKPFVSERIEVDRSELSSEFLFCLARNTLISITKK